MLRSPHPTPAHLAGWPFLWRTSQFTLELNVCELPQLAWKQCNSHRKGILARILNLKINLTSPTTYPWSLLYYKRHYILKFRKRTCCIIGLRTSFISILYSNLLLVWRFDKVLHICISPIVTDVTEKNEARKDSMRSVCSSSCLKAGPVLPGPALFLTDGSLTCS